MKRITAYLQAGEAIINRCFFFLECLLFTRHCTKVCCLIFLKTFIISNLYENTTTWVVISLFYKAQKLSTMLKAVLSNYLAEIDF